MYRDRNGAQIVYLFPENDVPDLEDLIETIDPAPVDRVGTVAQQEQFEKDWRPPHERPDPAAGSDR